MKNNMPHLSKSIYKEALMKQAERRIRLYRLKQSPVEAGHDNVKTYTPMAEDEIRSRESNPQPRP